MTAILAVERATSRAAPVVSDRDAKRFWAPLPAAVFVVAALAGLLHIAPVWHAQSQTPQGWTYTGNLSISPDYMQYRVWARQTQTTGILVDDRFTSEPNGPHLPVPFYYAVGQVSLWTGWPPEFVYDYAGSALAFGFTILLFAIVRYFLGGSPHQTWWVFLVILLGGGLGAYLKLLNALALAHRLFFLDRALLAANSVPLFEDYRGIYVFLSLFDTHYLTNWLAATAAILSMYFTLRRFSVLRLALTATLFAVATFMHLYEGPTLIAVTAGVALLCWYKGLAVRSALITLAVCTLVVGASIAWLGVLYGSSGLPVPTWRAVNILFSTLLIGYPIAWILIASGLRGYWQRAGLKEIFLLGWVLGCTTITLSAPFYPYPDRGTLTLQIPLYIVAGVIYFSRRRRVRHFAAVIAVLALSGTPAFMLARQWLDTRFDARYPFMFLNDAHREMLDVLDQRAVPKDVLLEEQPDALWIAPGYAGRHYSAHFFLTVDYDRKQAEIAHFFQAPPEEQAAFLQEKGIRFLYVDASKGPERFVRVPDLVVLDSAPFGWLFEYAPGRADAAR